MEPSAEMEQEERNSNEWFAFKDQVIARIPQIEEEEESVWENLDFLKSFDNPSEILQKYLEKNVCFTGNQILSLIEAWEESRLRRSDDSASTDIKSEATLEFSDSEQYKSMVLDFKEDMIMASCRELYECFFPGSSLNDDSPFVDESEGMSEYGPQEFSASLSSENTSNEDSPSRSVSERNSPSRSVSSERSGSPSASGIGSPSDEGSSSQSTSHPTSSTASVVTSTRSDSESGSVKNGSSEDISIPKSISKGDILFVSLPIASKEEFSSGSGSASGDTSMSKSISKECNLFVSLPNVSTEEFSSGSESASGDTSISKSISKECNLFVSLPNISKDDPPTLREGDVPVSDNVDQTISKECDTHVLNEKLISNSSKGEPSGSKRTADMERFKNVITPLFYKVKLENENEGLLSKQDIELFERVQKGDKQVLKEERDEIIKLAKEKKESRKRIRDEEAIQREPEEKREQVNPTHLEKKAAKEFNRELRKATKEKKKREEKEERKRIRDDEQRRREADDKERAEEFQTYFKWRDKENEKKVEARRLKDEARRLKAEARRLKAIGKSFGKDEEIKERTRQELNELKARLSQSATDQEKLKQLLITFTQTMLMKYDIEMRAFYKQLLKEDKKCFVLTDENLSECEALEVDPRSNQARETLIARIGMNISSNFRRRQIFLQQLILLLYELEKEDTEISGLTSQVIEILRKPPEEVSLRNRLGRRIRKKFIGKKTESSETLATVEEIKKDTPNLTTSTAGPSWAAELYSVNSGTDSTPMDTDEAAESSENPLNPINEDSAGMDVDSIRLGTPENVSLGDDDRNPLLSPPTKKSKSDEQE